MPALLEQLKVTTDAVVINQCGHEAIQKLNFHGNNILWIDSATRGLSVSRNLALKHSTGEFLLLVDDDEVLSHDLEKKLSRWFDEKPDKDILAFQVNGIERKFKSYAPDAHDISRFGSMKLSSVELALRGEAVRRAGISFNESFGSGAKYKMGEENIFLFTCFREKLSAAYVPEVIAGLHMDKSSWFTGFNEKYFTDRGATYYEMFGSMAGPMVLQFLIRKKELYQKDLSFGKALQCACSGIRERKMEKRKQK